MIHDAVFSDHFFADCMIKAFCDNRQEDFKFCKSPDFPTFADLVNHLEYLKPQYFNYFSIHGMIVFVRKRHSVYQVVCKNWNAPELLGCPCISHNRHQMTYVIRETEYISLALGSFYHACEWLLLNQERFYKDA